MESIRKYVFLKKILCTLMIIFLLTPTVLPIISIASTRPDTVRVVTDEGEKEVLLGTTSEKARRENILGLASNFSLFTKDDITVTKADAEGRIASGGTITSTAPHPYHAGTEVEDDNLAKIIAEDGISSNLELEFTTHATKSTQYNVKYDYEKKKIAAIGTNANNIKWNEFSNDELNQIVASDLIDFDEEFEYLQNQSNYLAGLETNGEIIKCKMISGLGWSNGAYPLCEQSISNATVFKGNNKLNVFSMTVKEFNELCNYDYSHDMYSQINGLFLLYAKNNIIFDVPKDSYIIINIIGAGDVQFSSETVIKCYNNYTNSYYNIDNISRKANIYFLADNEDISDMKFKHFGPDTYRKLYIYARK